MLLLSINQFLIIQGGIFMKKTASGWQATFSGTLTGRI